MPTLKDALFRLITLVTFTPAMAREPESVAWRPERLFDADPVPYPCYVTSERGSLIIGAEELSAAPSSDFHIGTPSPLMLIAVGLPGKIGTAGG